jgi:D-alanyl-D-alanine carboxypeptidase
VTEDDLSSQGWVLYLFVTLTLRVAPSFPEAEMDRKPGPERLQLCYSPGCSTGKKEANRKQKKIISEVPSPAPQPPQSTASGLLVIYPRMDGRGGDEAGRSCAGPRSCCLARPSCYSFLTGESGATSPLREGRRAGDGMGEGAGGGSTPLTLAQKKGRMRLVRAAMAFVCGLLTLPLPGDAANSTSSTAISESGNATWAREVDHAISSVFDAYTGISPGLWVAISDPVNGNFSATYGQAIAGDANATEADHFRIGSISKTFLATIALMLVDDGKLKLTDTVGGIDRALGKEFPQYRKITVEQLLRMESGVQDIYNKPDGIMSEMSRDTLRVWEPEEVIQYAFLYPVLPSGIPSGYSTTDYIVLQELIEAATHESLEDLIATKITGPLGMNSTTLPARNSFDVPSPRSHGYATFDCALQLQRSGATVGFNDDLTESGIDGTITASSGGGSMYSVLDDLLVWAESGSGNHLLSSKMADKRLKMKEIQPDLIYGMGVMQVSEEWFGYEGEAFGSQALAVHNPSTGVSMAIASNTCGAASYMLEMVLAVYPDT